MAHIDRPAGIAVIGIACRFPGAADWRRFWRNLCDGVESLSRFSDAELLAAGVDPADVRNPDYVKAGFVLPEPDGFDAGFFGYSPHEARLMDPQQRLLLEAAWESFEDAGYPPGQQHGPVGVFAATGSVVTNYMVNVLGDHPDTRGRTASVLHIGNDKDFAATRVSFKLDLTGPSLNVQTACSTSLVLVHLACKAIRDGECAMALAAAGVMRVPQTAGYLGVKGAVFSPDGHIRTFDAEAGGTVFASGIAAVLLKDARQAVADGDHIYAVIRGTAMNNDGARKASYAGTSVRGQTEVMAGALATAGIDPATLGYVECHGTGTTVGDPREFTALKRVFDGVTMAPGSIPIGSAKPNIGHAEQAAGLASLIKTAMAVRDGVIPPTINFAVPNPRLKLESSPFFVNTALRPWPRPETHPRRALINGLGIGGTNAAVVVEEAEESSRSQKPVTPAKAGVHAASPSGLGEASLDPSLRWDDDRESDAPHLFLLSAKTPAALEATLGRHRAALTAETPLADLCFTLAAGRQHFDYRLAVVARSGEDLAARLASAKVAAKPARSSAVTRRLAFLFSGQGAQAAGMGLALYRAQPAFRAALDRVAAAMAGHLDRPLLEVLADGAVLHQTVYTQPALFAVEYALAELLGGWGIRPDAVVGHSVGEFAAACLAGVFPLETAARLICARGRLMQALPAGGAMAALLADEATVAELIAPLGAERIAIAAVNGPAATVVSGDGTAVRDALGLAEQRGITGRPLTVSHAFHSPLMQPALAELHAVAGECSASPPALPWISTFTGAAMTAAPGPDYWCDQARQAVRFAEAMRTLAALGITDFVEIGPGTSLLTLGQSGIASDGQAWLPTLGKGEDEAGGLLGSVGALYARGYDLDWNALHGPGRRRLSLPTYAFERKRVWYEGGEAPRRASRPAGAGGALQRLASPLAVQQFQGVYGRPALPWLEDHRVHGAIVLPTTAGLTAVLQAARPTLGDGPLEISDFVHAEAMVLKDDEERPVHLSLEAIDGGRLGFALSSQAGDTWRGHMQGSVGRAAAAAAGRFHADTVRRRCSLPVVAERYYAALRTLGLGYGPAFRGVQSLWRGTAEALARVRLPDGVTVEGALPHPALLDACLHVYPAVVDAHGDFTTPPPQGAVAWLPLGMESFTLRPGEARELWVHARRRKTGGDDQATIDITAYDPEGRVVAEVSGLTVKPLPPEQFRPSQGPARGWLYRLRWDEAALPTPAAADDRNPPLWLLVGGGAVADALAEAFAALGARCRKAAVPDSRQACGDLLQALAAEAGGGRTGIVHLAGLEAAPEWGDAANQRRVLGSALDLAQAAAELRGSVRAAPKLWLVTGNAVAAKAGDPPCDVLQAGLWGFGRSLALEAPAIWGGLVDITAEDPQPVALAAQLTAGEAEGQVALRGGKRLVARLVPAEPPPRQPRPETPGRYLVTGGLGALGIETADWLARHRPSPTLLLVSRQGEAAANAAAVRQRLEALGATVEIVAADLSQPADVAALMARLRTAEPPLRGIYHSAGVIDDGLFDSLDWRRFRRTLAPKLDAAWALHQHSRDLPLQEFVLYSSVLSLIGSAGQTNYTAANACLDALAAHRRALGLPGLSVNWGPWAEAGLASALGEQGEAAWRARGMHYLSPELGREAFAALFDSGLDHGAVIQADWPAFLRQFAVPPAIYAELRGSAAGGLEADIAALRGHMVDADPAVRRAAIGEFLARQVTSTLGLAEPVPLDQPLRSLGLDSLMAVTLINRVESATGVRIPAVKLIRGPSIAELIAEVWPELAAADGQGVLPAQPLAASDDPARPRDNPWLVRLTPRTNPRFRVFCFPFAGGGSAAFQTWAPNTDPAVELIAVEPPGRLARIQEKPVSDMGTFVSQVVAAMRPLLDVPFALFGHCLGGLTLYEVARRLLADGQGRPRHLFCSGARPPDRVRVIGDFEKRLARHLLTLPGYQPQVPAYRQPDDIFAEIIRQFDMAATDQFLGDPELRRLMLPAVRAEFEMTSNYRVRPARPFDIPITCFISRGDPYVSREDILGWGRFTNSRVQVFMREGTHYSIFEDAAFIQRIIARELTAPPS